MRVIFAGSPDFAVSILSALLQEKLDIVGVFCQPDRPQGRGLKIGECAVKKAAIKANIKVSQPENIADCHDQIASLNADVMVVAAFGQILPQAILDLPKFGCINVHASMLPRWRGAAPIQRAILAGDKTTAINIIQMDAGLDTGAVLLAKKCPITSIDTAQTLHDKLAILGADTIKIAIHKLPNLTPVPQSKQGVSYAKKLKKTEAEINWQQTAEQINQQIRAFNPYPIAKTTINTAKLTNVSLKIIAAEVINQATNAQPATILAPTPQKPQTTQLLTKNKGGRICEIATKDGILRLKTVQLPSKSPTSIQDFTNAHQITKIIQ